MPLISLRLPDDLETSLQRESARAQRPKSEIAREAIAEYLDRRARERFEAEIARAARFRGNAEAIEVAAEALPLDNESLELTEDLAIAEPRRRYGAVRRARIIRKKKR